MHTRGSPFGFAYGYGFAPLRASNIAQSAKFEPREDNKKGPPNGEPFLLCVQQIQDEESVIKSFKIIIKNPMRHEGP